MVAPLDANAMDGQSPAPERANFSWLLRQHRALRQAALPRTEVNWASGSPFNRVVLSRERSTLRSTVAPDAGGAIDAIHEFQPFRPAARVVQRSGRTCIARLEAQRQHAPTRTMS
jgi:hypothetical protein